MAGLIATGAMTGAYSGAATIWDSNAALAYAPMARHLVDRCPIALKGSRALDAGAGTGIAGATLRDAGASVIATDLELDMASFARRSHRCAVVADVVDLPFRDAGFDVCVAAFVVNHLADPVAGLSELRRVTRRDGVVLASTFSVDRATAKAAVDDVAQRYGFCPPPWYSELHRRAAAVGTVARMSAVVDAAGFRSFDVTDEPIDVGLEDPALVVRYRLGLPHLAQFFDTLTRARQDAFMDDAISAVVAAGEVFRPAVIEVVATIP